MFSLKVLPLRQGQGTDVPRMIVETVNQSLIQTLKLKSSEPARDDFNFNVWISDWFTIYTIILGTSVPCP